MQTDLIVRGLPMVALTVAVYAVARQIFLRYRLPLLHPVFLSAGAIILVLYASGHTYEDYRPGKDLLGYGLGPATVALGALVYRQRAHVREAGPALLCGVVFGTFATIAAVLCLATLGRLDAGTLDAGVLHALAVKSVTAPIAVELARLEGGDPSLAAVFVNMTGIIGAMLGPPFLTRCRVLDPVARGIALGSTTHALGTAAALNESETAGAMASLAMIGAAIVTSAIAPVYVPWLLGVLGA